MSPMIISIIQNRRKKKNRLKRKWLRNFPKITRKTRSVSNSLQALIPADLPPRSPVFVNKSYIPSEGSDTDKETYSLTSSHAKSKRKCGARTYLQSRKRPTDLENELMGGTVRESGMDVDTRLCLTWRTCQDLRGSPGNSAQYSVRT